MTRIFFSHASEDKALVQAVYSEFVKAYPQHEPWVDKYEIVGGDVLLDKIAQGMDEADKFFIFLSPTAVQKSWVQRELRRAIMREIDGVDPTYIVPVRIGELDSLPAFLEGKLYIDLARLQKQEWLAQFDAAIQGAAAKPTQGTSNVDVRMEPGDVANKAHITFSALAWAEEFAWVIATTEDIQSWDVTNVSMFQNYNTLDKHPRLIGVRFEAPELRPGKPIVMEMEFDKSIVATEAIEGVMPWPS